MALAEDVTDEASVVAVGDNLIHPVVYNDALQQDGSFNFKPMYYILRTTYNHQTLHLLIKNLH